MIRTEHSGQVALIHFSRAEKRNALTPQMLDTLRAEIAAIGDGEARALVLAGDGLVFCGGFDLQMCHRQEGTLELLLSGLHEAIVLLRALPLPVIVAAHGAAIAGGCALLGGADVVVTDRAARLGYPVISLGISPAVSAPFLRLAIGDGPCRARMLEATLISGEEAHRMGLAHELVETPDAVLPLALDIARQLAAKPPGAIRATRHWMSEVESTLSRADPGAGLAASLAIVGNPEQRRRLADLFN